MSEKKKLKVDLTGIKNTAKIVGTMVGDTAAKAKESISNIDMDKVKETAAKAGEVISDKANVVKYTAVALKDEVELKLTELDRELASSITDYNDAFTLMNDNGYSLYLNRVRSLDLIENIETLINSIANHPKEFDKDFELIQADKASFTDACEFAEKDLQNARKAAEGAGASLAAGATVACMAPTAAMWVATTFGTSSKGVAISTLSGAAAKSAALAWLGGGTVAQGAGGMAAGKALLALAGPVGVGLAGATLLTTIVIYSKNKAKTNKAKSDEIESIKKNTQSVKEVDAFISATLEETVKLRDGLSKQFSNALGLYNADYTKLDADQKSRLGTIVNNTKSLSALYKQNYSAENA